MCSKNDPNLDAAYALKTPDDSLRLYADWAKTYDASFATASDYILPQQVALHFAKAGGAGPVLDIGAGTGLCAAALAHHTIGPIDGTDISQEMLDVAAGKNLYRKLFTGDLTQCLPVSDNSYAAITSSGTFTSGHVGPSAIHELLRITQAGGLLALSINTQHFAAQGFADKLTALAGQITDLTLPEVAIYAPSATGPHKDDTAFVAMFRKV